MEMPQTGQSRFQTFRNNKRTHAKQIDKHEKKFFNRFIDGRTAAGFTTGAV